MSEQEKKTEAARLPPDLVTPPKQEEPELKIDIDHFVKFLVYLLTGKV